MIDSNVLGVQGPAVSIPTGSAPPQVSSLTVLMSVFCPNLFFGTGPMDTLTATATIDGSPNLSILNLYAVSSPFATTPSDTQIVQDGISLTCGTFPAGTMSIDTYSLAATNLAGTDMFVAAPSGSAADLTSEGFVTLTDFGHTTALAGTNLHMDGGNNMDTSNLSGDMYVVTAVVVAIWTPA